MTSGTTGAHVDAATTIGIVGLGRMGSGIRDRLRLHGHVVLGYDRDPALADVPTLEALVAALPAPRVVWVMVPAGEATEETLSALGALLAAGDTLIEGGNSRYTDSIRRGQAYADLGIDFVDAGVSGGIWGLREGFCIMAGGAEGAIARVAPVFASLTSDGGWAHVGPSGAGHYTKMIHNGIEYGMLQAFAEGFELLHAYDAPIDLRQVAALWNHGSVVRSWLLELAERAFERDPELASLRGYVEDSGEGRWTVIDAIERGVPAGVIAQSIFARFASRDDNAYSMRVIAALRNEFGGHATRPA
ncbi:MAG: decarboxylating 6-phosphogluconate dehydrogenase [Chloroflexi bacterium]|nr:decarboxylating 6-phosphogluconate dehydrogenase [Chloroflexota bacterium]